jgi:hypothetical protein
MQSTDTCENKLLILLESASVVPIEVMHATKTPRETPPSDSLESSITITKTAHPASAKSRKMPYLQDFSFAVTYSCRKSSARFFHIFRMKAVAEKTFISNTACLSAISAERYVRRRQLGISVFQSRWTASVNL